MDPNKIHIDELVRQRLQGGEEEPRPGAWITMRELLDKQMPTGRPLGGLGWGAGARWTIALVLLTLLAGGYGAMDIRRHSAAAINTEPTTSEAARELVSEALYSTPANTTNQTKTPAVTLGNTPEESSSHLVVTSRSVRTESRQEFSARINSSNAASASPAAKSIASSQAASRPREAGRRDGSFASSSPSDRESHGASRTISTRRSSRQSVVPQPVSGSVPSSSSVTPANPVTATTAQPVQPKPSANRSTPGSRRATPAATRTSRPAQSNEFASTTTSAGTPRSTARRATRNSARSMTAMDSAKALVQSDTLRQIRIAHRYLSAPGSRSGRYVADTLASEPYIIEKPLPVMPASGTTQVVVASNRQRRKLFARKTAAATVTPPVAANTSAVKSNVTTAPQPASAAPASAIVSSSSKESMEEALVPLSSSKVSSHKNTSLQYTAHQQLQDAMRRARFAFAQMRLYTGVTGGFNTSVGGTAMGGFQVGMLGLLAINDKWSIGMEGKFVQRFNRGTELHDPYFQHRASTFNRIEKNGEAYNVYRVTTDSFEHYYKLSTIETIELPLYARYTYRRLHGFAGANLTYGLRINNMERVERFAGRESNQMDTVLSSVAYTPPPNTAATVAISDFGPRFGIGYAAGLGYQATPSILVDVRMTQLLWDNRSAGAGGLRVSQTFYRVPSLQLSIGYRFSQRMSRR